MEVIKGCGRKVCFDDDLEDVTIDVDGSQTRVVEIQNLGLPMSLRNVVLKASNVEIDPNIFDGRTIGNLELDGDISQLNLTNVNINGYLEVCRFLSFESTPRSTDSIPGK